jgi:DNA-binding NarL/FixJ family response regulator
MMSQTIRVVLADDHPMVRRGIHSILDAESDIALVGEASTGTEARQLCLSERPEVLLLDMRMPGISATDNVAYLATNCPDVRVVMLSAFCEAPYVIGLLAVGIKGYILKDEMPEALVRALRNVADGYSWFSLKVLQTVAEGQKPKPSSKKQLTMRELEVLKRIRDGLTDREISDEMNLAERTVRYSLRRIYDKLDVDKRIPAVVRAMELGLI